MERDINAECELFFSLSHDTVRMLPVCENPCVRLGTLRCEHFIGDISFISPYAKDVTHLCRRAKECKEAPRMDK